MKNEEKFKTAEERDSAFIKWCDTRSCDKCELYKIKDGSYSGCQFHWLALEAEEQPEPCPFCGSDMHYRVVRRNSVDRHWYECTNGQCEYQSAKKESKEVAFSVHNRVARAVRAAALTTDGGLLS